MKRRIFLSIAAAAAIAPIAAVASDFVTYTDGVIEQALAEGKTVFGPFGQGVLWGRAG